MACDALVKKLTRLREVFMTRTLTPGTPDSSSTNCLNNTVVPPIGGGSAPIKSNLIEQ
jgi:hypothetical protein